MKNLIRKILKEETNNRFDKLISWLKPPYFQNMELIGVSDDEYKLFFSKIFNQPVKVKKLVYKGKVVYNKHGYKLYIEGSNYISDDWEIREFDEQGNVTYYENNYGRWSKLEYDEHGNEIYRETNKGIRKDNR